MITSAALLSCLALVTSAAAVGVAPGQIKTFVTFGDSYTDSSYYPTADGGYQWPTWAAGYGPFNLYGFARSGAACSNYLTNRPFPPIIEWQLPAYFNETSNGTLSLDPQETIYTIWIGTNDLGVDELLTGSVAPDVSVGDQLWHLARTLHIDLVYDFPSSYTFAHFLPRAEVPTVSIVPVRQCAIDVLTMLYESGARNFIMQNIIPLDLTILYSNSSYPSKYWTAQRNSTEWNVYMRELARAGNRITDLQLQALAPTLQDAHIASFDSYGLFSDIYNNPGNYLNGTAPFNVTSCIDSCVFELNESTYATGNCTVAEGSAQDSFMWYDELHFSQQTARVVAREMTAVMSGGSSAWATWLS